MGNQQGINTSIMIEYYGDKSSEHQQSNSAKNKQSRRQKKHAFRQNFLSKVIKIQRAWRANAERIRVRNIRRQHQKEQNTIFKGEFALSNDDKYIMYYENGTAVKNGQEAEEADLGSVDSDAESQFVSLSGIHGVHEMYDEDSASFVNEFKIKTRKICSPMQNMVFLPQNHKQTGVRIRMSRLGDGPQANAGKNFFESDEVTPKN